MKEIKCSVCGKTCNDTDEFYVININSNMFDYDMFENIYTEYICKRCDGGVMENIDKITFGRNKFIDEK